MLGAGSLAVSWLERCGQASRTLRPGQRQMNDYLRASLRISLDVETLG